MSYILDALRKADAQRERDPARGIHAQPTRFPGTRRGPRERYRLGIWAAGLAGLVALAWTGWYLFQDKPAPPPTRIAVATPRAAAAPRAAATSGTAAAPAAVVAATEVLPPPPPAAAPAGDSRSSSSPTPRSRPQPAPAKSSQPAGTPQPAALPAATADAAAAQTAAPAASPPGAAGSSGAAGGAPVAAVPLPPDAPKLAISGGVYSANAAQRMLIVNGQVVNEGAELGPGLVLEEIRPKAAVLRFRGSRYTVFY